MSVSKPACLLGEPVNDSEYKFTVHNFTNLPSSCNTSSNTVLEQGLSVIRSAVRNLGWRNPVLNVSNNPTGGRSGKCYTLATSPPRGIFNARKQAGNEPRLWDAPFEDYEIFSTDDLEDFESVDLTLLFGLHVDQRTSHSPPEVVDEPVRKRRKFDCDSLLNIIPQPHIHPSPFLASYPPPSISQYKKSKPIPLHPTFTTFSPAPFSRTAWLIPVRGNLPWHECTSALILRSSRGSLPSPVNQNALLPIDQNQIIWTRSSLVDFWEFLLAVRKAGTLGPIGVSFHPASDAEYSRNLSIMFSYPLGGQNQAEHSTYQSTGGDNVGSTHSYACQQPLMSVDYIKIYHNAEQAMYLRNALDAWRYVVPGGENAAQSKTTKIRVLLGAKLVLLDERSQGVLIA